MWRANQGGASGTFNIPAFIKPNNAMSSAPTYTRQITISSGGDFTPTDSNPNLAGEYIKAVAATSTAQRNTAGGSGVSERGLAAGDYYMIFTGTNASYRLVFEERP